MNSIVEAKVRDYLRNWLHYGPVECGTVVGKMTEHARVAGFELDDRFAFAGLGAGPEARVASRIVGRAIGEWGDETSDYAIRRELDEWLRKTPRRSLWGF
jgi:hypothetical protein